MAKHIEIDTAHMLTAQYTTELSEHQYWWLTYDHFSRSHESLRVRIEEPTARKGKQRPREYRKVTPAVELVGSTLVSDGTDQLYAAIVKEG